MMAVVLDSVRSLVTTNTKTIQTTITHEVHKIIIPNTNPVSEQTLYPAIYHDFQHPRSPDIQHAPLMARVVSVNEIR